MPDGDLSVLAGRTVDRVATDGEQAEALHLSDGTVLPCDFVVLATGVFPNTEFLDGHWATVRTGSRKGLPASSFGRFIGLQEIPDHLLDVRFFLQARVCPREVCGGDSCAPPAEVPQDDRESLVA